jgi:hypothetical protein
VLTRTRFLTVVALLVLGLAGGACGGGGGHSYKAGTPAATGAAPDCSAASLDLVSKTLGLNLTGPHAGQRPGGTVCTFGHSEGGSVTETVQLNGNVSPESFAIVRDGFKASNVNVHKISGWGDEAYAASVKFLVDQNNFAVRKGKVAVVITSSADYDHMKKLMKALLAKL